MPTYKSCNDISELYLRFFGLPEKGKSARLGLFVLVDDFESSTRNVQTVSVNAGVIPVTSFRLSLQTYTFHFMCGDLRIPETAIKDYLFAVDDEAAKVYWSKL